MIPLGWWETCGGGCADGVEELHVCRGANSWEMGGAQVLKLRRVRFVCICGFITAVVAALIWRMVTLFFSAKFRDWRLSGGFLTSLNAGENRKSVARMKTGTRSVDLELTILGNVFNLAGALC
jgi:hypothetical protein